MKVFDHFVPHLVEHDSILDGHVQERVDLPLESGACGSRSLAAAAPPCCWVHCAQPAPVQALPGVEIDGTHEAGGRAVRSKTRRRYSCLV